MYRFNYAKEYTSHVIQQYVFIPQLPGFKELFVIYSKAKGGDKYYLPHKDFNEQGLLKFLQAARISFYGKENEKYLVPFLFYCSDLRLNTYYCSACLTISYSSKFIQFPLNSSSFLEIHPITSKTVTRNCDRKRLQLKRRRNVIISSNNGIFLLEKV